MIVTAKQIEVLKLYIPNIEKTIATDNVQLVLDEIDDIIINNILENNNEPNNEGVMLQKVYDEIFDQN